MKILLINQPFWPDVVATAQHMADWGQSMAAQGHQVTVIASRSVYGQQGAVLPKREEYRGIKIYRVGANLFKKGRILTRLVDFGLFHLLALWRALTLPRQDVVVCLTTPPMIGVVGMLLKTFRRTRYIQYEMDLYPDVPVALGVFKPRSLVTRLFERIHRRLLRSADRVIVLGRCMHKVIAAKNIAENKLVLITPWADPDELQPLPRHQNPFRKEHGLDEKFVIMYSGNLGLGHDITTLCSAMEKLAASSDPLDQAVRFVFIGGGRRMQEIRRYLDGKHLANTLILDYQPRESLAETLSAADVHLITQAPGTTGLIVPSKFYGILAAGRPSIYIGPDDTEVALSIREDHLGTVLAIGQVHELLAAIRALQSNPAAQLDMQAHARSILTQRYSRAVNTQKLTTLAESLVPTKS